MTQPVPHFTSLRSAHVAPPPPAMNVRSRSNGLQERHRLVVAGHDSVRIVGRPLPAGTRQRMGRGRIRISRRASAPGPPAQGGKRVQVEFEVLAFDGDRDAGVGSCGVEMSGDDDRRKSDCDCSRETLDRGDPGPEATASWVSQGRRPPDGGHAARMATISPVPGREGGNVCRHRRGQLGPGRPPLASIGDLHARGLSPDRRPRSTPDEPSRPRSEPGDGLVVVSRAAREPRRSCRHLDACSDARVRRADGDVAAWGSQTHPAGGHGGAIVSGQMKTNRAWGDLTDREPAQAVDRHRTSPHRRFHLNGTGGS